VFGLLNLRRRSAIWWSGAATTERHRCWTLRLSRHAPD
jgi:hypothetical protein